MVTAAALIVAEFERGDDGKQALYGILQGGVHEDLRHEAAEFVNSRPFFGNAVGGTLGGTTEEMDIVVGHAMAKLNRARPTHLLGIGGSGLSPIAQVLLELGVKVSGSDRQPNPMTARLAARGGNRHAPTNGRQFDQLAR